MTSDVLVVAAHHTEHLDFVQRIRHPVVVVSKTRDDIPGGMHTPVNKGFEASAYLEYIVAHYDTLAEYTVFVHAHEHSWHHDGALDDLVNSLAFEGQYRNINSERHYGNTDGSVIVPHMHLFSAVPDMPVPRRFRLCAQFYAHRDLLRRHPVGVYRALLDTVYTQTSVTSKFHATLFEWCWHAILTGLAYEHGVPEK